MDEDQDIQIKHDVIEIEDTPEREDAVTEIKDDVIEIDSSSSTSDSSSPTTSALRSFRRSASDYFPSERGSSRNIREHRTGLIREGQRNSIRRASPCSECHATRLRRHQYKLAACKCDKRRLKAKRDVDILAFFNENLLDFDEIKSVYEIYIKERNNLEDIESEVSSQSLLSIEDYASIIERSQTMKALFRLYGGDILRWIQKRRARQHSLLAFQNKELAVTAQKEREYSLSTQQVTDDSSFRPQQLAESAHELSMQEISVNIDDHSTAYDDPLDLSSQNLRRQETSPETSTFREAFDAYVREACVFDTENMTVPLKCHTPTATRHSKRQQNQYPKIPQKRNVTKYHYLQAGEVPLRPHSQSEPVPLPDNRAAKNNETAQHLLQSPQQHQPIEQLCKQGQQQTSPIVREPFTSQLQQEPQFSEQQISSNLQQQAISQYHSTLQLEQRTLPHFQNQSFSYPQQRATFISDQQPFHNLEQQSFPYLHQQQFQRLQHQSFQRVQPHSQQQPASYIEGQPFPRIIGPTLQSVRPQLLPRLQQPSPQHSQQQSFQQLHQQSLEHLQQESLQRLQRFYSINQSNNIPITPVTISQGRYFPH